jgi:hypothetical protein
MSLNKTTTSNKINRIQENWKEHEKFLGEKKTLKYKPERKRHLKRLLKLWKNSVL